DGSKWIETVPKHGYRFTAPVSEMRRQEAAAAEASPASAKSSARRAWPVVAMLLAATAAVAALAWWRRRPSTEPPGALTSLVPAPLTTYPGAEFYPTLSPDGSQVAFSWDGSRQDNFDIYVKLVGPGEPHRLTTDPALDFSPAWSPDGRQIAFLRSVAPGEDDRSEIFVIPALGGAERRLGEIGLTTLPGAVGRLASRLAWTPDGKWVAAAGLFARDRPAEIWLLSPETGERRRLGVVSNASDGGDVGPAFSPDGRFLALLRYATRSVGDVYLLPLDADYAAAGPLVRLTHENRSVGGPCWNAQGTRSLYSSR